MAIEIRTVTATRYVTPLREGGSLPAIIEADDDGMYVLKFWGAGQGPRALIAELIGGEVARALGLLVPEVVFVDLDPALGKSEPDWEIQELLERSPGLNLALDYLPGSIKFDPVAPPAPDADLAAAIIWLDAFITNVDRTARNPNLLRWHKRVWLIDHGAAFYFHHTWTDYPTQALTPFSRIRDHVLLPFTTEEALRQVDANLRPKMTDAIVTDIITQVPDAWLGDEDAFADVAAHRHAYVDYLTRRCNAADRFVEEAIRARASLVGPI